MSPPAAAALPSPPGPGPRSGRQPALYAGLILGLAAVLIAISWAGGPAAVYAGLAVAAVVVLLAPLLRYARSLTPYALVGAALVLIGLATAWFGPRVGEYTAAGLLGLTVMGLLVFRPYWYLWFLFPALLSWSYSSGVYVSARGSSWMDTLSPWQLHLGPMPLADTLVLLLFLRVVCDPRFTERRQTHRFDLALGIYLLAYPLAALVGMMTRDSIQTWQIWLYAVRAPILLMATYVATSRLIPRDQPNAARYFLLAPLIGLGGAILGSAYRALVLHQIVDRAGSPILLVSEANMLPSLALLGVAYLATGRRSGGMKILSVFAIFLAWAVLLISTRRSLLILSVLSFLGLFVFLPPLYRRRAVKVVGLALVACVILATFVLAHAGKAGQLWSSFMSGSAWSTQGTSYRTQELTNVVNNLNKYGGWLFGEGMGRRWEHLGTLLNLWGGSGFGADTGHVWIFPKHFFFLSNLLDQGLFGLGLMFAGLWLMFSRMHQLARQSLEGGEEEVLDRALVAALMIGFMVSISLLYAFPNVGLFAGGLLGASDCLLTRWYKPSSRRARASSASAGADIAASEPQYPPAAAAN